MRMYCFGINLRFVTVIIFLKDGMRYGPHHHQTRARRHAAGLLRCLGSTSFPPRVDASLLLSTLSPVSSITARAFSHAVPLEDSWLVLDRRTSDPLACPSPCNDSHLCCPRTSRPGSLESLLPTNAVMWKTLNTVPTQSACTCQTNDRIPLTWSSGLGSQPEKTRTSPCAHSLLALRVAFTARRSRQENPGFSTWSVLRECTKTTSSIRECRNATEMSSTAKQGAAPDSPTAHIAINRCEDQKCGCGHRDVITGTGCELLCHEATRAERELLVVLCPAVLHKCPS